MCVSHSVSNIHVHTAGEQIIQRWNHEFRLSPPALMDSIVNEVSNVLCVDALKELLKRESGSLSVVLKACLNGVCRLVQPGG